MGSKKLRNVLFLTLFNSTPNKRPLKEFIWSIMFIISAEQASRHHGLSLDYFCINCPVADLPSNVTGIIALTLSGLVSIIRMHKCFFD